jgi:type I restriction-modification system DNA methylase subunit
MSLDIVFEYNSNDQKDNKKLLNLIDKAHNILYNSENISGENALNDIMNFLFLKMLEPIISDKEEEGKIDIFNKKYYKDLYDNKTLDTIFKYFNINELCKCELKDLRDMNSSNDVIRQVGDILITHPITKMIYTENNFIKAKKATTIQNLLDVIKNIDLDEFKDNEDIIGDIYEHFINGYAKMKGSMLGQFFTPRKLMKLILNYKKEHIEELINNCGDSFKIYDSCMGTGGWIISGYNMFKSDKILLSGGEVEPRTFQFGLMNLISTLHKFPHDVQCESSLTHIDNKKHNLILTNPPFKTSFPFKQLETNFKEDKYNKMKLDEVYKLKNNNPPVQFLELNYYKLEDKGICIIVLPYGELFFGAKFKKSREHFMNKCNITDIILMPSGIFTHTGVKTCVLIFDKNDKTKEIKFSESNQECTQIQLLKTVNINEIKENNNFSWRVNDYIKQEIIKIDEYIQIKTLDEVCELQNGKRIVKGQVETGEYPVLGGGGITSFYTNEYSREGKTCKISREGMSLHNCVMILNEKYYLNSQAFTIKSNNESLINDYLWYYLDNNKEQVYKCGRGAAQKAIDIDEFKSIKIPIPSIEKQNKIVKQLDFINKNIIDTQNLILQYNQLNEIFLTLNIKDIETKKLGDICKNIKAGKFNSSDCKETGLYPFYTGKANNPEGFNNEYCFDDNNYLILIKDGGAGDKIYGDQIGLGKIFKVKGKSSATTHQLALFPNDDINNEYLYCYLTIIKNKIMDLAHYTTSLGCISKTNIENLDIPIPSIEIQNKIVEYCEHNNNLIIELNKMIDNNKLLMKDIITNL